MKNGFLITFEGIDKSGKTTQIEKLKKYLLNKGLEVSSYGCLDGSDAINKIGQIILDKKVEKIDAITELLLYESARRELIVNYIKPDLENGKIVILDRYIDSTFVYQGKIRKIRLTDIEYLNNLVIEGIIPDITFFINISEKEYLNRIKEMSINQLDKIEIDIMNDYSLIQLAYQKLQYLNNRIVEIQNDDIDIMFSKILSYLSFL